MLPWAKMRVTRFPHFPPSLALLARLTHIQGRQKPLGNLRHPFLYSRDQNHRGPQGRDGPTHHLISIPRRRSASERTSRKKSRRPRPRYAITISYVPYSLAANDRGQSRRPYNIPSLSLSIDLIPRFSRDLQIRTSLSIIPSTSGLTQSDRTERNAAGRIAVSTARDTTQFQGN